MYSQGILTLILAVLFLFSLQAQKKFDEKLVDAAIENGKQATEGYVRLIPTILDKAKDVWKPHNSAADKNQELAYSGCL